MTSRNKIRISLVVPTMCRVDDSVILKSFQNSSFSDEIFVQFVFLMNSRSDFSNSEFKEEQKYSVLTVGNDRHFGTCEENLYRIQDITDLLEDIVCCIGDDDEIDWAELVSALEFFAANKLDAMGINQLYCQRLEDGTLSKALAVQQVPDSTMANSVMNGLLSGAIVNGKLAFSALIAVHGPIDWPSYIGSHLFSRGAFAAIINRQLYEHCYSFVYKQATFFHENETRYAFYSKAIITRVGDEFLRMKKNISYSIGSMENHPRTAHGHSPIFHVANLALLSQINDKYLFNTIAYSLCYMHLPNPKGEITVLRVSLLHNSLAWASRVLQHKILGRSRYFPDRAASCSVQDIIYVSDYFDTLTRNMTPPIKALFGDVFVKNIICAKVALDTYVRDPRRTDFHICLALSEIESASKNVRVEKPLAASDLAYGELAMSLANRQSNVRLSI